MKRLLILAFIFLTCAVAAPGGAAVPTVPAPGDPVYLVGVAHAEGLEESVWESTVVLRIGSVSPEAELEAWFFPTDRPPIGAIFPVGVLSTETVIEDFIHHTWPGYGGSGTLVLFGDDMIVQAYARTQNVRSGNFGQVIEETGPLEICRPYRFPRLPGARTNVFVYCPLGCNVKIDGEPRGVTSDQTYYHAVPESDPPGEWFEITAGCPPSPLIKPDKRPVYLTVSAVIGDDGSTLVPLPGYLLQ